MPRMVRWGVMGTASIAVRRVIPAIRASASGVMGAIASRHAARAAEVAMEVESPLHFGSYQELLDCDQIDAVYIPLPNPQHVSWAIRAIEAGKHVLCEKPIGMDADEARSLIDFSARHPQLKVMEAFMYRFHPRWAAVHDLVTSGGIGELATVHVDFFYDNHNPDDIRNRLDTGGGALLDIGCYGASVARWLFGREPRSTSGTMQRDPQFGTDRLTSALMDFAPGSATFTCATQLPWHQHVSICGTTGRIELDRPFNPLSDQATTFRLIRKDADEEITFTPADQYTIMVERFNQAILTDGPVPTPLTDALANMVVLDAVRASGE